MRHLIIVLFVLGISSAAWAQNTGSGGAAGPSTRSTTRPAGQIPDVDAMMRTLLVPDRPRAMPITPAPDPPREATADRPVKPNPPPVQNLLREGTLRFDRLGRLSRNADGQQEFIFDGDGEALADPPMLILPNLKLMDMENIMKNRGQDLRFKISGVVTEYNGRNYILLTKALVAPVTESK